MSNDKLAATFHGKAVRWTVGVDVPWATEVISMNARSHWTNTHRQAHALRARGFATAKTANPTMPFLYTAACIVYVRFPDKRRRDLQNYHKTLKPLLDGFVDAGLLPDDDSKHLVGLDVRTYAPGFDPVIDGAVIIARAGVPKLSLVFDFTGFMR